MTTLTNGGLQASDLSAYPRPVQKVLLEAVNKHGVPFRLLDGMHLMLYNGGRDTVRNGTAPFKVGAARGAEYTLRRLIPWLEQSFPSWSTERERGEVSTDDLAALAEVLNGTEHPPKAKPEPDALMMEPEEPETDQWVVWKYGFERNGNQYRCTVCGQLKIGARGAHLHERTHKRPEVIKEIAKKGSETRALNAEQRKVIGQEAVRALAEIHGLRLGKDPKADRKIAKLEKSEARLTRMLERANVLNARLMAEKEALVKERDEAKARLSLIHEAMKA